MKSQFPHIYICLFIACHSISVAFGQNNAPQGDTLKRQNLDEVIIISNTSLSDKTTKPLSNLEKYLESTDAVNMIQRGSYASEPYINGMATERSVITIDGMRIYSACTDKMAPVTSYVEITNLEKADLHHGQSGSTGGATIAGSLDLVRKKSSFGEKQFKGLLFGGLESNNLQKIGGFGLSQSSKRFYTDFDFTFRDAENYKAGKGILIPYSQYTKFNTSANIGVKITEHKQIESSFIYDHAINIGYPALPMDVAYAKAFIGSVEYLQHHISENLLMWRTKVYYNTIAHAMDDSKRPNVPIRMDMPGKSSTGGFYSLLEGVFDDHSWKLNLSGHHNNSLAEMTMFSNIVGQKDMYMLTWPGVYTNYVDLYAEDIIPINFNWEAIANAGVALQLNEIYDSLGFQSLQIFYNDLERNKLRLLPRLSVNFKYTQNPWNFVAGIAYGERAPSVSEGYGYYLFNSFDRYDYIGNPEMKNEKSVSANSSLNYKSLHFNAKLSTSYFYMSNYIIGMPVSYLSAMTIGASGVRIYEQLSYAHLYNANLSLVYRYNSNLKWSGKVLYRRGIGANNINLPLIQPLSYHSEIIYTLSSFSANAGISGATKQSNYNPTFGEQPLPAYTVFNSSVSKSFNWDKSSIILKVGVENVLDKYYTTFADWNRIPRMGRSFFVNVICNF